MALMTWGKHLSVGVKALDVQHARLVRTLNQLHAAAVGGADRKVTCRLIHALVKYLRQHLTSEETMLERIGYPGFAQHRRQHGEIARRVDELVRQYDLGELALSEELLAFLRDWLVAHIRDEDRAYSQWLNQRGVV